MFDQKVGVIIGAGASCEFGLPAGDALARSIAKACSIEHDGLNFTKSGDGDLFRKITKGVRDLQNAYYPAAQRIAKGIIFRASVDDFVELHQGNEAIAHYAKAAIVRQILKAEAGSSLSYDRSNIYNNVDFPALSGTWIIKLLRMIDARTATETERAFENIVFVVFNYDRCLEHFLLNALRAMYDIPYERASEIMRTIRIYHPYGMAGNLPTAFHNAPGVPFGGNADVGDDWPAIASAIKTYTENVAEETKIGKLRRDLANCDTVIFLGFGFHRQNMDIIWSKDGYSAKRIFASAYGFSEDDMEIVRRRIAGLFLSEDRQLEVPDQRKIHIQSVTCADLFDRYRLSMVETG